jgi:hypothetical protein
MSEKERAPMWVGITYLIYATTMLVVAIGGTGYAVFVLGHSGWWFVLAVAFCGMGYMPRRWRQLWTGDKLKGSPSD